MFIKTTPERITIKGYKGSDCTCVALGNSLGLSYDLARKILQNGRYYNNEFHFVKDNPITKSKFTQKHMLRGYVKQ